MEWNSFFYSKDWQRQKENGTNDEGMYVGEPFQRLSASKGKSLLLWGIFEHFNVGENLFKEKRRKTFILLAMFFPYTYGKPYSQRGTLMRESI